MKKRSMIYVLIAALLVTMLSIASSADAAKKPALNKKKATLSVGDKLKLKVKNNKKTVKWSTSKKKVATVTKKGVVTAKSAGKANITAKIGKTKLVCKVTVNKKEESKQTTPVQTGISIAGISFLNQYQIQVQLSGAQALTAANFTVKSKIYELGTYNKTLKIQSVTTTDNINYLIELMDQSYMENNSFVQVTVTGLKETGTEVKEAFYNRGKFTYNKTSSVFRLTKGEEWNETLYFDHLYGNCVINSVTGLPAGIKYDPEIDNRGNFRLYGTPAQAGVFTATVTATGELGNVENYKIYFLIGAEDALSAFVNTMEVYVDANGTMTRSSYDGTVYVSGGSGNYLYEIVGEAYGMTITPDGEISGLIKTPGKYGVNIKVTDNLTPTLTTTCTMTVNVSTGKLIKGTVKDISGNPAANGAYVIFDNKDESAAFYGDSTFVNDKGEYSILLADGTYTAYVYSNGVKSAVRTITVNADMTGIDFVLPAYKITFVYEGAEIKDEGAWSDSGSGKIFSSDKNVIYLPEGTYNLKLNQEETIYSYEAEISNLVVNASSPKTVNVKVKKTSVMEKRLKGTIGVEKLDIVTDPKSGLFIYYKFVPSETKTYYFYSEGISDTLGKLLNEDGDELAGDDDSGDGMNFSFEYNCEKDKTYYYGVRAYSTSAPATIAVSETAP